MVLDEYREYLIGAGKRPNTARAYVAMLRRALEWCDLHNLDLLALRPTQMVELADEFKRSSAVRAQLRSALTHYWTMRDVTGPARAIDVPSPPKGRWRGLEDPDVERLLEYARPIWPQGGVIYIGVYMGLRREEIAGLAWSAFNRVLTVCQIVGKGSKTRELPVHPILRGVLLPHRWGDYVFPGRYPGEHIHPGVLNYWVPRLAEEAGVPRITPHQLRHISGGKVVEETSDIQVGQAWLGHSRVTTTETYSRVGEQRMREALGALNWQTAEPGRPHLRIVHKQ